MEMSRRGIIKLLGRVVSMLGALVSILEVPGNVVEFIRLIMPSQKPPKPIRLSGVISKLSGKASGMMEIIPAKEVPKTYHA